MRLFRRKSNAALLNEIIERQQGPQPARPKATPSKPRSPLRVRAASPWRFYVPFFIVLVSCSAAAGYFFRGDLPALSAAFERAIGQAQVASPSAALAGRASIIDGDTIEIRGQSIRLWGIDAPESAQLCQRDGQAWYCGRQAALALSDWIGERTAICEQKDIDRYRRIVGRCTVGGTDVSAWLVENGWALAFRRYSLDYVANEDRARRMRSGIWASEFMPPWEWRAARRPLQ